MWTLIKKAYWEANTWFPVFVLLVLYKLWFIEGMSMADISYQFAKETGWIWPHDFIWFAWAAIYHGILYLLS